MGFADYLSRNPSGKASSESEDEEKINTNQEIKHAWLKHTINPSEIVKPTGNYNQWAERKQLERNDVTHAKANTLNEQHAFCLNTAKNKLHSIEQKLISHKSKFIANTTRNNPNKNTFDIEIRKRKRAPNKKLLQMNPQTTITNLSPNKQVSGKSTHTEVGSNKGKGITPIQNDKHEDLFPAIDDVPTPEYRANLLRVFNEKFLAEHSKKDLGPIIDLVIKQDWLTLKQTNPITTRLDATYLSRQLVVYYLIIELLSQISYVLWYSKLFTVSTPAMRVCLH